VQVEKASIQPPPGIPASMVAAYVQRWVMALPDARAALAGSDHNALRVLGHRLKGSGGGYGIPQLTQIGARIEEAAKRGDAAELRMQVGVLEVYLNRIEVLPE
jgi:HPt (histidine-containing phosphotransfer) domain-containing protein